MVIRLDYLLRSFLVRQQREAMPKEVIYGSQKCFSKTYNHNKIFIMVTLPMRLFPFALDFSFFFPISLLHFDQGLKIIR